MQKSDPATSEGVGECWVEDSSCCLGPEDEQAEARQSRATFALDHVG